MRHDTDTAREQLVREYLATARAECAGDLASLPTSHAIAQALRCSATAVQRTGAWREHMAWRREQLAAVPRECRVCGKRSELVRVLLCHTHLARWDRWGRPEPWQDWADACREHRLNTCEHCGTQFNGAQGRITRCRACDQQVRRERALRRYHALTPEQRQARAIRSVAREREKRAQRVVDITCAICARQFRGLPDRKFCSRRCSDEQRNRLRREIRRRTRLLALLQQQENINERLRRDHE